MITNNTFCGLEVASHPFTEGAFTIKGTDFTFDEFRKNIGKHVAALSASDHKYEPFVINIDPAIIEGIMVNPWELEHQNDFWSMHNENGTMESFVDIARQIPEVRDRIASGEIVKDLMNDPKLGACTRIYFDMSPSNAVTVWQCGNFFVFKDNGRHRIIAARLAKQIIPVRITQITII